MMLLLKEKATKMASIKKNANRCWFLAPPQVGKALLPV